MDKSITIFISGHTDLSFDLFKQYYIPKINKYLQQNNKFIIGDALGADKFAQEYLSQFNENVTIYDKGDQNNKFIKKFNHINRFKSFSERDCFMTNNSDIDITFLRNDEYAMASWTSINLIRRKYGDKISKNVFNILRNKKNKGKSSKDILLDSKIDRIVTTDILDLIDKHIMIN